jgi:adenylate cyclase
VSDVFISYARSTAKQAQAAAEALKALGYSVWLDDELLAHHAYTHAIEEQLTAAKVALVIWSAEAVKSEWVLSEANRAREDHKLVQLTVDGARLPMPFDQTQCADLAGWNGDASAPGWRKVAASVADLVGGGATAAVPPAEASPPPLPTKPSIAVLPFANLSGDPEQDYFADGMVEEITTALSRIRSIFVIASGSTLSFKGKALSPQEVARELGVRYVLDVAVRRAASRVRISAKLIDATDGSQIWADRFDDTLDDIFDLQDRVALSVAGVIGSAVQVAEVRRASTRPTENMSSYDLFLRALPLYLSLNRADTMAAIDLLDRAIAIDPSYGQALALAAMCRSVVAGFRWSDDPERDRREAIDPRTGRCRQPATTPMFWLARRTPSAWRVSRTPQSWSSVRSR